MLWWRGRRITGACRLKPRFRFRERPRLKEVRQREQSRQAPGDPLWPLHTHTYVHILHVCTSHTQNENNKPVSGQCHFLLLPLPYEGPTDSGTLRSAAHSLSHSLSFLSLLLDNFHNHTHTHTHVCVILCVYHVHSFLLRFRPVGCVRFSFL